MRHTQHQPFLSSFTPGLVTARNIPPLQIPLPRAHWIDKTVLIYFRYEIICPSLPPFVGDPFEEFKRLDVICRPLCVGDVVEKEDVAEGVIFRFEEGEEDGIGAGDGEDVVEDVGAAEYGDPGPADEETTLKVGGSGRGDEEPGWPGFMCMGRSHGSSWGEV